MTRDEHQPGSQPISVVMFDWDGTLIHSLDIKVRNAGVLFEQTFRKPAAEVERAYRLHSGVPRRMLFEAICAELGLPGLSEQDYVTLSGQFTTKNRTVLLEIAAQAPDNGLLPEDSPSTLRKLQESGYALYVSSSADPLEIREVARSLDLERYFLESGGEILGSQPGFFKGPQHVAYVERKRGVSPKQIAFVGDEPADIRLGKEAGVVTIGRTGTCTADELAILEPDAIIGSLGELPRILEGFALQKG